MFLSGWHNHFQIGNKFTEPCQVAFFTKSSDTRRFHFESLVSVALAIKYPLTKYLGHRVSLKSCNSFTMIAKP